jgi:hypothetical protein
LEVETDVSETLGAGHVSRTDRNWQLFSRGARLAVK